MIGMLWYDNDSKKTVEQKIQEAIDYYVEKYAKQPTACYINPKEVTGTLPVIPGIKIGISKSVLRNHFYVGIE